MFYSRQLRMLFNHFKRTGIKQELNGLNFFNARNVHIALINYCDNNSSRTDTSKEVTVKGSFESIENKNKGSYLEMVKIFMNQTIHRRGHVEFIYSALRNMETFEVHKDLEVYKTLIDVLPKGKFIPQNIFQAEFMHYPKQQQCIVDLLEQMEDNGVLPDGEMESMLLNIFGRRGHPLRKYWRMMYWMPKFKNLSPWPVPNPPPDDIFELAKLAIARISSIDFHSEIAIYHSSDIPDTVENTWIISAQSPAQVKLLNEHTCDEPIYVEGSFKVWLRNKLVNYFILRANAKPTLENEYDDPDDVSKIKVPLFNFVPPIAQSIANVRSVHEQEDGIILAVCATGTSSKDSLLSWIRHLEKDGNPILANVPIVFTLRTAEKGLVATGSADNNTEKLDDR